MVTIREFIETKYWPRVKAGLSPQWQTHTEYLLGFIVSSLGDFPVNAIPPDEIDGWWTQLRARFQTPVTPNKCLVRAKHVLKTAIRWKLATENPFAEIKKEREPEKKFTPLSEQEHEQLFNAACEKLQWYMIFARYTGARRSSLAKLEERDINLERNTITFRQTKNGEDYTIPIHPALRPRCERGITGKPERRVLPQYKDVHTITDLFRRLRKRLKAPHFRFHDFRHNVGTRLAEKGYDVKARMQLLGHKDPRMAIRYTHIAKEVLERALTEAL